MLPFVIPDGGFLFLVGTPPSIGPQLSTEIASAPRVLSAGISDAVVALIAEAAPSFNQSVTVERQWVEEQQRQNMKESDPARIIVVPKALSVRAFDLKPRNAFEWDIGVWIDKVVKTTVEGCDPVAGLMEQIVMLLVSNRDLLAGPVRARLVGISPHPTYDSMQLIDIRVFRSVFLATYRVTQ